MDVLDGDMQLDGEVAVLSQGLRVGMVVDVDVWGGNGKVGYVVVL